jgi:hypothetical protein
MEYWSVEKTSILSQYSITPILQYSNASELIESSHHGGL